MTPNHDDGTRDDATQADDRPPTPGQTDAAAELRDTDPATVEADRGVAPASEADGADEASAVGMTSGEVAAELRDADPLAREAAADGSTPFPESASTFRAPAPLHEPAPLRGPAPLRVSGYESPPSMFATSEPIVPAEPVSSDEPTDSVPAASEPIATTPIPTEPFEPTPAEPTPATTAWIAADPREPAAPAEAVASHVPGPADEPAVARLVTHVEPIPLPDRPDLTRVEPSTVRPETAMPIAAVPAAAVTPAVVPVVVPLAGATVAAAPAVVVKTRTGPVALDTQPPLVKAPTPAPVPIVAPSPAPVAVAVVKPARLASLDIFRGATIAMMLLVNNDGIGQAYAPLEHAPWHGLTPTDLVFPFFLFIVGVATPFSLGKRAAIGGQSRGALLGHIWLRALSLVLLGILLSGFYSPLPWRAGDWPESGFWFTKIFRGLAFPLAAVSILTLLIPWRSRRISTIAPLVIAVLLVGYCVAMHFVRAHALDHGWNPKTFGGGLANPDRLRIPGILQRIGICYGVAATLALFGGRFVAWVTVLLLFGAYSWLMLAAHFPGHTVGSLTEADNFAHSVDVAAFQHGPIQPDGKHFQDHTWREYADNEGIVSTLPAIGTALLGVLAGWWLRRADTTAAEKCAGLLARGVAMSCLGVALGWWLIPVNKNLWTPSFSVLTAGLAMLGLGWVFWLADVRGRRWFFWPFKVFGMNAIAAFVAASVVVRISSLIPFETFDHAKQKLVETTPVGWLKLQARDGVVHASDWLGAHHVDWLGHALNSPQNTSLAGALAFVLAIFVLMLLLYVCRIFVKV